MSDRISKPLSATLIVLNEAHNIRRCLDSVAWIDDITVFDSGSTDNTVEICREYGCRIITGPWEGFGKAKQRAVDAAKHDWILSIDADEEISPELKDSISGILENPQADGYRIHRRSFYLGRLIRHSGWDRDYTLRLFNRTRGGFNEKTVHESVQIPSDAVGIIEAPLYHYSYPDLNTHIKKISLYTDLAADAAAEKGKKSTLAGAILKAKFKFFKMYILQGGIFDGKEGLILAVISAFGIFMKYMKIREISRKGPA